MDRVARISPGVERARWLGELAEAIEQAQLVSRRLGLAGAHSAEALDLYCRLEAARDEVERLRGGGWRTQRNEIAPEWALFPPGATSERRCANS